ncbi:MAG: SRPBCC family protein [Vicinamibacterales bacterium]
MSQVDVSAEVEIAASPADIAAVMFDPAREPEWMNEVTGVEIVDPALAPGARVKHMGQVLGRAIDWLTVVEAVHFPHVLTLRIGDGPFVGTVHYQIQRSGTGSVARMRSVGEAPSLGFVPAAMIAAGMRSALGANLARLKALVEV